jgi:hypothetical protein
MTFEKMDQIREQQEQLARLHFEMDIQQDMQRSGQDPQYTIKLYQRSGQDLDWAFPAL